jgi:hypothetical protein
LRNLPAVPTLEGNDEAQVCDAAQRVLVAIIEAEEQTRHVCQNATRSTHQIDVPELRQDRPVAKVADGRVGAYGHSWFRELVFGGVTEALSEGANLPVFLAH